MTKTLLASFLAATMAFTSLSATPARAADSGEIGRFLLGAGTLFIIGSAISNQNRHRPHVYNNHGTYPDRDVHQPVRRKIVPRACLRQTNTRHGVVRIFAIPCLRDNMRNYGRLPQACLQRFRHSAGGWATYYTARCLRNKGWRTS